MVPNLSSVLYEFTNREKDRIDRCFRVGNFHSLRDLPKHLLPGNVSYMSQNKVNENLYGHHEERSYIELQRNGGYFSKFIWRCDPYELYLEKQKKDRAENYDIQDKTHEGKKFYNYPIQNWQHKH